MDIIPLVFATLQNQTCQHLLLIFLIYIATWWKSLFGDFLIDDDMGIQQFSDKFRPESKDAPELLVDYYNQEVGKDDKGQPIIKAFKNTHYNAHLGFPGAFMRWHRLNIGKEYKIIGKNKKEHEVYGWVQNPFRHHLWSMLWYAAALFLCYNFLSFQFGPTIAFAATLLFAIHPIVSQSIAWISGINYVYCLTFLLANYNILQLGLNHYWTIPLTILFTALSSLSLLVGCFNFSILWFMGYHWEAFAAAIVGILVMLKDGVGVVKYRRAEFKRQNMENSITPNIRKPIVMMKTLWYYICLITVPKSLGLYHNFGYHYSRKDEEPSAMFWLGLISFAGSIAAFWYGNELVRFCILWFYAYFLLFSNFFTANQFVVERYVFIPSIAYCILFAWLIYPYQQIFWLLIGLYTMRSCLHVWTFQDHISFYESNILNFPNSEVAYGNLGCSYQGKGMSGAAFDMWVQATKINPHYDVPWYNMHSLVKTAGQFEQALEYLKKCMNAKVVHFKNDWTNQLKDLENTIMKKKCHEALNNEMSDAINQGKSELIPEIKKKMEALMKPGTVVQAGPPQKATS